MARDYEIDYDRCLSAYDDALDQADAQLMKIGLHSMTRPTDKKGEFADLPMLPDDIGQLSYRELTLLMGRFTAWYGYALGRQADAQCQRNCSEKKCKAAWSKLRKFKDGTVSDKDDAVRIDSRYVSIDSELERDEDILIKLRAIVEGLKRGIESVSRSISALDSRTNVEGRGATAARRQGSETAQEAFRSGRRSALDAFKKRSV